MFSNTELVTIRFDCGDWNMVITQKYYPDADIGHWHAAGFDVDQHLVFAASSCGAAARGRLSMQSEIFEEVVRIALEARRG